MPPPEEAFRESLPQGRHSGLRYLASRGGVSDTPPPRGMYPGYVAPQGELSAQSVDRSADQRKPAPTRVSARERTKRWTSRRPKPLKCFRSFSEPRTDLRGLRLVLYPRVSPPLYPQPSPRRVQPHDAEGVSCPRWCTRRRTRSRLSVSWSVSLLVRPPLVRGACAPPVGRNTDAGFPLRLPFPERRERRERFRTRACGAGAPALLSTDFG